MLFELTNKLPETFWVAVSGGADSMVALHWLNKPSNRNRLKGVIHINHNTGEYANKASELVSSYCLANEIIFKCRLINSSPPTGESKENWWRNKRYDIFKQLKDSIILGHHLDDCVEEYIMCTMVRGFSSTIPYQHGNCVRPFRLWRKQDIYSYAERYSIPFLEDPSNFDTRYKRNLIRNRLLPVAYELNPGLHKIVVRMIKAEQ